MGVLVPLLIACSGFLLAVLWMDLMFDVQVLAHRDVSLLPESVLTSIADYYHRATTTARPMGHVIAAVMAVMLVSLALRATVADEWGGFYDHIVPPTVADDPPWLLAVAAVLAVAPVTLALARTVPNAVRLGRRTDSAVEQTRLARSICVEHACCLHCIAAFLALWLLGT